MAPATAEQPLNADILLYYEQLLTGTRSTVPGGITGYNFSKTLTFGEEDHYILFISPMGTMYLPGFMSTAS